ncbi:MAG: tetratricopeptide repeat protein [Deltaproteobacteria bacterium]|nr:MAG: tetratricopeptide repeat protein [Deltaproteobacteria bacterium]
MATNKDKLLESAQKFLAKGQLAKAISEYQKLIEAFPKDYRNRQKLAELLSREKRNDEAQPHYEAVAKNFAETGFYLKAIAIYKQMQKIEPGRVDIYLRLAELNEKQGLIGNALNEYRSLIAFYDKNRMGRETVGVLQKMIALDPESLGFRSKLIETLVAIGEDPEALDQLKALVRFLAARGEAAKIVKLYEKFIDLCPEDVDTRLPLAEALVAAGQPEKALTLLKTLLKQAPDHPVLLTTLTDCHLTLGNHADARLTCQHLLKEQPQDLQLRERYSRICIEGGDYERALENLEESKELFSRGNRVDALRELYELLQPSLPGNPRLEATLAAIYDTTGGDGGRPAFSSAVAAEAVEETADAAVLDAAIGDVEQLDLVGDVQAPPVVIPPLGAPAAAPPAGGLELELDLDLDLDVPAAEPPPATPEEPVVQDVPGAVEGGLAAGTASAEPALEVEFDLGSLDGLELEPPPAEAATDEAGIVGAVAPETGESAPAGDLELDLGGLGDLELEMVSAADDIEPESVAPEPAAEFVPDLEGEAVPSFAFTDVAAEAPEPDEILPAGFAVDVESVPGLEGSTPVPAESTAAETADFSLPSFEIEPPVETFAHQEVPPPVAEASASDLGVAGDWSDECIEELEVAEEIEEIGGAEEIVAAVEAAPVEDFDETELLDELEELDEIAEVDAAEEEEVEPLEELEELEDLEELEELEADAEVEEAAPFAAAALSPQQLRNELEDAEFYLRQGLFDDAERVVRELVHRHGELPELTASLAEVEAGRQAAAAAGAAEQPFSLMADIKDGELLGAADFLEEEPPVETDDFSRAEPGEEGEDAQSHFDLGIAYKEMGLFDDAIAEFGKAARDPSRRLDCLIMKGQCHAETNDFDRAEEAFKAALDQMSITEEVRVALQYELGLLYEAAGRLPEALEKFQIVADLDLFFRDVTDKLKSLRQTLGLDEDLEESIAPRSNRDRISFV